MKLIMQLMPKMLVGNIGQSYLKNSKSVIFSPSACGPLESLIKVMSNGFVSDILNIEHENMYTLFYVKKIVGGMHTLCTSTDL